MLCPTTVCDARHDALNVLPSHRSSCPQTSCMCRFEPYLDWKRGHLELQARWICTTTQVPLASMRHPRTSMLVTTGLHSNLCQCQGRVNKMCQKCKFLPRQSSSPRLFTHSCPRQQLNTSTRTDVEARMRLKALAVCTTDDIINTRLCKPEGLHCLCLHKATACLRGQLSRWHGVQALFATSSFTAISTAPTSVHMLLIQ
jgi:hypothetical protein